MADSTSVQLADVELASSLHTTTNDLPEFRSQRGLTIHSRSLKENPIVIGTRCSSIGTTVHKGLVLTCLDTSLFHSERVKGELCRATTTGYDRQNGGYVLT